MWQCTAQLCFIMYVSIGIYRNNIQDDFEIVCNNIQYLSSSQHLASGMIY